MRQQNNLLHPVVNVGNSEAPVCPKCGSKRVPVYAHGDGTIKLENGKVRRKRNCREGCGKFYSIEPAEIRLRPTNNNAMSLLREIMPQLGPGVSWRVVAEAAIAKGFKIQNENSFKAAVSSIRGELFPGQSRKLTDERFADLTEKKCTRCNQFLPVAQFPPSGRRLNSHCRECRNQNRSERALAENLTKFGISREQYDALLTSQGAACRICGSTESGHSHGKKRTPLVFDHCHTTGKFRGLLCNKCNRAIGNFKDDPSLLDRAAAYLRGMD